MIEGNVSCLHEFIKRLTLTVSWSQSTIMLQWVDSWSCFKTWIHLFPKLLKARPSWFTVCRPRPHMFLQNNIFIIIHYSSNLYYARLSRLSLCLSSFFSKNHGIGDKCYVFYILSIIFKLPGVFTKPQRMHKWSVKAIWVFMHQILNLST